MMVVSLVVMGWLVFWLAGTWAFAFWHILRFGSITFVEPNMLWLYAEFYLAVLVTVASIMAVVVILKRRAI